MPVTAAMTAASPGAQAAAEEAWNACVCVCVLNTANLHACVTETVCVRGKGSDPSATEDTGVSEMHAEGAWEKRASVGEEKEGTDL